MMRPPTLPVALMLVVSVALGALAAAEGPRLRPGELALDPDVLRPINVLMQWEYEKDGEPAKAPLLLEYDRLRRQGEVVGQIRWLASGGEWPAYDLMLVDHDTFEILVRHEPLPGGGFSIANWQGDGVSAIRMPLRGEIAPFEHDTDGPVFDIATFPLLFAAAAPALPEEFAIPLGDYETGDTKWAHIRHYGETVFVDARGASRRARRFRYIDFDPEEGRSLDYYVTAEPPYWIGMELLNSDGSTRISVRFDEYQLRAPSLAHEIGALPDGQTTGANPADIDVTTAEEALEALDQAYVAAWKQDGSAAQEAALRLLFADDVLVMPGRGTAPKRGWPAIRDFWFPEGAPPTNVRHFEHTANRVDVGGDLGAIAGWSTLEFEYDGREASQGGNYLIVARRNESGQWRIVQMIWNDRPTE